jgi:NodT family efflux transporter outer membrane factor (OMF) lipoprotein
VSVGYTPDVFGGLRRQVESLQAQANSQRFLLEATYLTLTSNLVAAAVQEAGLRSQIAAARDIIGFNTKSLELLRRQFAAGFVAGLDVAAQEAALAQAQQALPPLQKQLEQTRNLLAALAGRFPAEGSEEIFELSALRLPDELPVSLPSKLVEQRPDVRAAEEQLHAASAEIGLAVANMLPQFTISAARGGTATVFSQMFADGNPFWSVAGSVTQTIFAGGTLLHRKRAAEAAFDQAAAQYRNTVIAAFQNVADALYALQADADALRAAANSERAAKVTLDLVRKRLELGQVNYLSLLSAQQTYQQAVISRSQAQASRFTDTAALFQALGGGWWNRRNDPAR